MPTTRVWKRSPDRCSASFVRDAAEPSPRRCRWTRGPSRGSASRIRSNAVRSVLGCRGSARPTTCSDLIQRSVSLKEGGPGGRTGEGLSSPVVRAPRGCLDPPSHLEYGRLSIAGSRLWCSWRRTRTSSEPDSGVHWPVIKSRGGQPGQQRIGFPRKRLLMSDIDLRRCSARSTPRPATTSAVP